MSQKGKVLFIIHDVYQEDNEFPLGVGYLAAVLQNYGAEVRICCQDIYHYSNEELAEKYLKNDEYDLIGIGFLAARFKETIIGLCDAINKYKKKAKLILGGHGASAIPDYILKTTKADIIAIGEAEETIIEVLDAILNNRSFDNIKGIAYWKNDKLCISESRKPIKHIDELPYPAWDLFPMDIYTTNMRYPNLEDNEKALQIITSRGCTNKCTFCYRMEKGIRFRNIDSVVEEMKYLYNKYGVTYFVIQDELFIATSKRLEKFVSALKEKNLYGKIKYNVSVGIRADVATDELTKMLKDSGCTYVNIGFESVEQKCLDEYKKNTTVEDNIKSAELMLKHNLRMGINFIWGIMSDNAETLGKSVEFIKKFNTYAELRTIRPVTPYPGSELYYYAISNGLLSGPEDFFDKFKNSDLLTVNFTNMSDDNFYKLLFEANKELILDHYEHTDMSLEKANKMISDFYNLYFKGFVKFRGARHFERKVDRDANKLIEEIKPPPTT